MKKPPPVYLNCKKVQGGMWGMVQGLKDNCSTSRTVDNIECVDQIMLTNHHQTIWVIVSELIN